RRAGPIDRARVVDQAALGQLPRRGVPRGEDLRADAALEQDRAGLLEQDEGAAAGVGQGDRAEEDLVRERGEIQLSAERQPEIVERLQLEKPRLELELGVADLPRQAVRAHERPEEKREQRAALERLLARDPEQAQETVDLALRRERNPEVPLA